MFDYIAVYPDLHRSSDASGCVRFAAAVDRKKQRMCWIKSTRSCRPVTEAAFAGTDLVSRVVARQVNDV